VLGATFVGIYTLGVPLEACTSAVGPPGGVQCTRARPFVQSAVGLDFLYAKILARLGVHPIPVGL